MTKKEQPTEKNLQEEPLAKLLLDTKIGKFKFVNLLSKKVEELRKKDEYKQLGHSDLFEIAAREVIKKHEKTEEKS